MSKKKTQKIQDIEVIAEPDAEAKELKTKEKKIKAVKLNEEIGKGYSWSIDDPKLYQLPVLVKFEYLKETYS